MRYAIRKEGNSYFLNSSCTPLPEDDAASHLPLLQLQSGEYLWLLLKALLDVRLVFYRNPNDEKDINNEQDFYNHVAHIWEGYAQEIDDNLTYNSDILKCIPDEVKPDLILNYRFDDCQKVVVEVKRNVNSTNHTNIAHDFNKLKELTIGTYSAEYGRNVICGRFSPYDIGAFVLMCGTFDDLKSKLKNHLGDLRTYIDGLGDYRRKIFCICAPGNRTVEYTTMEELANEIQ